MRQQKIYFDKDMEEAGKSNNPSSASDRKLQRKNTFSEHQQSHNSLIEGIDDGPNNLG